MTSGGLGVAGRQLGLVTRASTAVVEMVEKGHILGFEACFGGMWCDAKAWEGRGGRGTDFSMDWDENFWDSSFFCCMMYAMYDFV